MGSGCSSSEDILAGVRVWSGEYGSGEWFPAGKLVPDSGESGLFGEHGEGGECGRCSKYDLGG